MAIGKKAIDPSEVIEDSNPSPIVRKLERDNKELKHRISELKLELGENEAEFEDIRKEFGAIKLKDPVVHIPTSKNRKVNAALSAVLVLGDWHIGEVVEKDEIEEFNQYSWDIAQKRAYYLQTKCVNWVSTLRTSMVIDELVVIVIGDMMCFPSGTSITMADGTVKYIEDVVAGDVVLSNPEPRKVVATHQRESDESDILITANLCKNMPLTGSKEHVVLRLPREKIETGWNPGGKRAIPFVVRDKEAILSEVDFDECRMEQLRVGDYLVVRPFRPTDGQETINITEITGLPISQDGNRLLRKVRGRSPVIVSSNEISIDNDLLWLCGVYMAEGSSQKGRSGDINSAVFSLNIKEENLSKKICEIIESKFGYSPIVYLKPDVHTRIVCVNNQIIATLLCKLCGDGVMGKVVHPAIYNAPRSLLPLVGGWIDGDGGLNRQGNYLAGVTVNEGLARQISTILWSEHISHGIKKEENNRNRPAYRFSLHGASAQQLGSYTVKHNNYIFDPTYEDGIWVGDCYCLRIMSLNTGKASGKLYDLSIEGNNHYQVNGVVVHNSGDIHYELTATNEFPAPVQAVRSGILIAKTIAEMAPHFKSVRVEYITVDNHSRLTPKPQWKEGGFNSYSYVTGWVTKERLSGIKNVIVNVYPVVKALIPIQGWKYLCMHGNAIKGWAGFPWYGTDRHISAESKARRGKPTKNFDKVIMGHFHQPLWTTDYIINGSLSGTSEFDHALGRHSQPAQVAFLVHPKYGEMNRIEFNVVHGDVEDYRGAEIALEEKEGYIKES